MHDGMRFFPLPEGSNNSDHGLLVTNHEYPRSAQLFADGADNMSAEKVRKMHATVGMSVIKVKRGGGNNGDWKIIRPSKYARRVHGLTPARLGGTAAGQPLMQSELDPYDPTWVPAKRTALGRCCHETAHYSIAKDGRVVI
jgi:uncharacterized protein